MKPLVVISLFLSILAQAQVQGPTGIWKAAANGSVSSVLYQISKGSRINDPDPQGCTALHHALNTFQTKIVPELLRLGADPNARDNDGVTPLSLCARNADAATMRLLIAEGARLDSGDLSANGAWRTALHYGSTEVLQLVLDTGFSPATPIIIKGKPVTPLHLAALYGNTSAIDLLVKNGADINAREGHFNNTPLINAAGGNFPGSTLRLIELGAQIDLVNNIGNAAINFAANKGHADCQNILFKAGAAMPGECKSILLTAWRSRNHDLMKKLASTGIKLPADDPIAALLKAIRQSDLPETKRLLSSGFYDFKREAHCALAVAAAIGNVAILEEIHRLAGDGEHLNCGDAAGVSQLHHAVICGQLDALDFYLDRKVNIDRIDFNDRTPLMTAAVLGRVEAIQKLVKAGARLDAFDKRRYNALDLARHYGQDAAASILENHGLKPTPNLESATQVVPTRLLSKWDGQLPPVTAALTPFSTTHEAWYQSIDATRSFAMLLQSKLEDEPRVKWVERTELDRAERELVRTGSGLVSPSQSLSIGSWVRADILLTGTLSPVDVQGREIEMRAVDARRGDVLAVRKFLAKQPPASPFTITPELTQQAEIVSRELIEEARIRLAARASQSVVAPLFIANRSKHTARLDLRAAGLISVFQDAAIGKNFRILNLLGTTDAHQEAGLSVSGLAQFEGNAWQRVADHYLWGWIEEIGAQDTPFAKMPVRITFELSGGERFTAETTVPMLEVTAKELAIEILNKLPTAKATDPRKAADSLRSHAKEWVANREAMPVYGVVPQSQVNQWRQTVKILDAARFFSPDDGLIAGLWLIERWNHAIYFMSSFDTSTPYHFWSLWQRKADWDAYVARFGFADFPPYDSVGSEKLPSTMGVKAMDYPKICWQGMCTEIVRELAVKPTMVPDGLPPEQRQRWLREMSAESTRRFLKLVGDPDIVNALPYQDYDMGKMDESLSPEMFQKMAKPCFSEAKKSLSSISPTYLLDLRQRLLRHCANATQREAGLAALSLNDVQINPRGVNQPRMAGTPPHGARAPLTRPPSPMPELPAVSPAGAQVSRLARRFAIAVEPIELVGPWGESSHQISRSFSVGSSLILTAAYDNGQGEEKTMIGLWSPSNNKLVPIAPSPFNGPVDVDFYAEAQNSIWMSDKRYGIGRIDLPSKSIQGFNENDGVPLRHGSHGAAAAGEFFVAGEKQTNQPLIAAFHLSDGWRTLPIEFEMTSIKGLYGFRDDLFCVSKQGFGPPELRSYNAKNRLWRQPSIAMKFFSNGAPDSSGLWAIGVGTVTLISSDLASQTNVEIPSDIRFNTSAYPVHDGDWLWVATEEFVFGANPISIKKKLLAIHKPTRTFRGWVDLSSMDHGIRGLSVTPIHLYLISSGLARSYSPALHSIDKAALIRAASSP